MDLQGSDQLTRVLQLSLSPVALVSGVGLLLLSMTNRVGRTTDLVRALARDARTARPKEREVISLQIRILYQRSQTLSLSIGLAVASILCTSVIIFCLFAISYFHVKLEMFVMALWVASVAALIASLGLFLRDNMLILRALRHEVAKHVTSGTAE
jgi:uncharacterized membrane protein YbhN (UPF0104 family)